MDRVTNRPTLADVAKLAGVSISTASRALSGSKVVATDTIQLVKEAATQVGYCVAGRPHPEHTSTLGVLIANLASPFYATLLQGVEDSARRHGYHILLSNSDYQVRRQQESLSVWNEKRIDGLLVTPIHLQDQTLAAIVNSGLPVVQVDRYVENLHCDIIVPDNRQSAYQAIHFLVQQGYERIGVVSGPPTHSCLRDRLYGYRLALQEAGLPVVDRYIRAGGLTKASAYQLTSELLDMPDRPDALFTTTLEMTTGALQAIRDRGLVIPRDIGLVVFDEFEFARLLEPPLTTVEQPAYDMGAAATDLLIRRIADGRSGYEPVSILFEARLIVRSSTRAQAGAKSESAVAVPQPNDTRSGAVLSISTS
jgi:LacI family transcriptional regulator